MSTPSSTSFKFYIKNFKSLIIVVIATLFFIPYLPVFEWSSLLFIILEHVCNASALPLPPTGRLWQLRSPVRPRHEEQQRRGPHPLPASRPLPRTFHPKVFLQRGGKMPQNEQSRPGSMEGRHHQRAGGIPLPRAHLAGRVRKLRGAERAVGVLWRAAPVAGGRDQTLLTFASWHAPWQENSAEGEQQVLRWGGV